MNDFSAANISKLIVHLIGNKSKEENIVLSSELSEIASKVTEQYLNQFFFSSFKFDLAYQFAHESDINLNEVYNYTSKIFQNKDEFLQQSVNISKHLYEVSTHPNIKKGELYVAYIQGCTVEGHPTDIIGIFKSETKDFYLDVVEKQTKFDISSNKGINTNKLDKGCLICDMETKYPQKIYIVDASRNDAHYWKKFFLNAEEVTDEYTNTATLLKTCKQFIKKECRDIEPTAKISLINNSVQYFETHDSFKMEDFTATVFKDDDSSSNFKKYLGESVPKSTFEKPFDISSKAVTVAKRGIKNFIKLDSNIEIRINSKDRTKAIEKMVEKGYDNDKKMSYYKIYYENEE